MIIKTSLNSKEDSGKRMKGEEKRSMMKWKDSES